MRYDFKVGDRVARDRTIVGEIINISDKRHIITVDYGSFTEKYDENGISFGYGYIQKRIEPLTDEVAAEIHIKHIIKKCKSAMSDILNNKKEIDYSQATKVLEILNIGQVIISEKEY